MRIIQIIDVRWYNACADFAVKQAQGLILAGHDVLLMANPGSPLIQKALDVKIDVSDELDFAGINKIIKGPKNLRKIARDFKADIIFAHRGESHLIAALAKRGEKFKVARFRGDIRPPKSGPLSRYLNTKLTDGIAVSTEKLRIGYESQFKLKGIPTRVIYPGVDKGLYAPKTSTDVLKKKIGLKPNDPVIGLVGRFSPVKGHRYFIEAAKLISLKYPRVQFVIAGGDAQITEAELKFSVATLKIPNVHFTGLVDNIAEVISTFDIGVVSSIGSEMICRVLLEYYSAGLPVVATAINQISEIVLQSNGGVLIEPANSVAMGQAIIDILANSDKSRELSRNGKSWVEHRSLLDLGRESAEFLNEVLRAQ